ncbi:MAG TPA: GNAT family N-acetyltransferase [Solirubrobacter sp.]|nr:GNAT family N-acetyltransferase [Solirubrobacter sp.]
MWTVDEEPVDSPDAVQLLRGYFTELTERYFRRAATGEEIDLTLEECPTTGLAALLVLRWSEEHAPDDRARPRPAGCLGLYPTGELTRVYVAPAHRRRGGARALLAAAESRARARGLTQLFLDTRTDLVEARALYVACGFSEVPPLTAPGPYKDHWYAKPLT